MLKSRLSAPHDAHERDCIVMAETPICQFKIPNALEKAGNKELSVRGTTVDREGKCGLWTTWVTVPLPESAADRAREGWKPLNSGGGAVHRAARTVRASLNASGAEAMPLYITEFNAWSHREFKRRADDNEESLKTRLLAYYKQTSTLVGYYYVKGLYSRVDGLGEIDDVQAAITETLDG